MADDTSNNRKGGLGRLPPLRGHLGQENDEVDLDRPRPLRECLALERTLAPSCIHIPNHPGTFYFRNGMIAMLPQLHGMESEKYHLNLFKFDEVCEMFSDQLCLCEITKMKLFLFTLKNRVKSWLLSLRPSSISTWSALYDSLLKKFFPNWLTTNLMRQIKMFS